jgi:hypothetical protein
LGCFLARQYRDTRLTSLEKPDVFRHNFSGRYPPCRLFPLTGKRGAKRRKNKKAGAIAGLLQFAVESAQ